ncbi:MAG: hypothetical protein IIV45_19035, partial [Lachnospiraceae bacterium]|nr:hypothetical protein [Lachnospiraceae bacterium]
DYATRTFANAIKGKKTGKTIYIDDASSVAHNVDVFLKNKNLWDGSSVLEKSTYNYTQNVNITEPITISLKKSEDLACSTGVWRIAVYYFDGTAKYIADHEIVDVNTVYSEIFPASVENPITKITIRATNITAGKYYDIQIELGNETTEYTPHITDFSDITVLKGGKNLWNNGDVTVNSKYLTLALNCPLIAGYTYTLSADVESNDTDGKTCLIYNAMSQEMIGQIERGKGKNVTFTPKQDVERISFYASNNANNGENDVATFKNLQIELGEIATEFEEYNGTEMISSDAGGRVIVNIGEKGTVIIPKAVGVSLEAEYNKDLSKIIEKLYNAIVNLGGTI